MNASSDAVDVSAKCVTVVGDTQKKQEAKTSASTANDPINVKTVEVPKYASTNDNALTVNCVMTHTM